MMGPSLYCDRARMWASLAADGEITEVERASLRAHTAVCPDCEAWTAAVVGLAEGLRTAPLVEPERDATVPARPRRTRAGAFQVFAAAAAVAVAVGLGRLAASLTSPGGGQGPPRAAVAATQEPYIEQQQLALLGRAAERGPRGGHAIPV
jgi:ferric-dicitrate binding protein FerR (iron transport regulator)